MFCFTQYTKSFIISTGQSIIKTSINETFYIILTHIKILAHLIWNQPHVRGSAAGGYRIRQSGCI